MYLTKDMTVNALSNMITFHRNLCSLFDEGGMDFKSNLGRRNVVMSQAQEHFFARELSNAFNSVESDGRTGKADIYIGEIDTELECKLTSGNRGKSVTYSFQTDWETLRNKGSIDYLYVLCDEDFEKFCVLFFKNLTVDDFYPPANGSRGKSRMKKSSAMEKVVCLHGNYSIQNETFINSYKNKVTALLGTKTDKLLELQKKYFKLESTKAESKKAKIINAKSLLELRFAKKAEDLNDKIAYWTSAEKRYSFILSQVEI